MDLFEYQAKELFAKHNVPTTPGRVTESAEDAKAIAEEFTLYKAELARHKAAA